MQYSALRNAFSGNRVQRDNPDMRLGAEVPLVALFGLAHLRVAPASAIHRRTGRLEDRSIYDRASGDADAVAGQSEEGIQRSLNNPLVTPLITKVTSF